MTISSPNLCYYNMNYQTTNCFYFGTTVAPQPVNKSYVILVWVKIGIYEYMWVYMTMYGYKQVCMDIYGYVWVCMAMYGYKQVCMSIYGYVWVCMSMYGYVWVCMGMYGYVWIYLGGGISKIVTIVVRPYKLDKFW